MELIKFLKENGLQALQDKYKVKATFSQNYPELVCLVYDQLETPKNAITNDCRGIVLNANTFDIIAYPFTRFNDYNPKQPTEFDKNNFRCFEKIDGSLISMYYYKGKWNISTKSQPDASGFIRGVEKTYSEYFFDVFKKKRMSEPKFTNRTYIFEFKFPSDTQFITTTTIPEITLIGCRDLETLKEISIDQVQEEQGDWFTPEEYFFDSFDEVLDYVKTLDPSYSEGVVVCDENFNRLKIKSPAYDLIALLRRPTGNFAKDVEIERNNLNRLIKISQNCEYDRFLDKFEELKPIWKKIMSAKKKLTNEIFKLKERLNELQPNQFGLATKDNKDYAKIAFQLKQADSTEKYLENCPDKTYLELLKKHL